LGKIENMGIKMNKDIICNYCFDNEELNKWIEKNGEKSENNFICPNCKTSAKEVNEIYFLNKKDLAEKLQEIIKELYEHESMHGLCGSAAMVAREENDNPNDYIECLTLAEVCWELFDDGDKLAKIISSNQNIRNIQQGEDDLFLEIYTPVWKSKCWWGYGEFNWDYFSDNVKHSLRFFDSSEFNRLEELQKLNNLFEKIEINTYQKVIFRARGAYSKDEIKNIEKNPKEQLGQAPKEKAGHNRFSPSGISYIYLAFEEKTAISEIFDKSHIGLFVAEFELYDNLRLLNLTKSKFDEIKVSYTNYFNNDFDLNIYCGLNALEKFINELKKPITENESRLEYIPTQILAEYIKLKGYDGFIFDSSKNKDGKNLVLFDNKINYLKFKKIYNINLNIKLKD
jgi:hypothetical protein